jgi:hypothetical protein
MTTLTHESHSHLAHEQARARNTGYDAHIIAGFGVAMIAVVIAVCALAASSGVDPSQIEAMSFFP